MQGKAMIAVWMNVQRVHDDEFNDWYETEHLAEVVGIEGVLSGRRYHNPEGALRYLVCYETRDESVESAPGFQSMLLNPTPWTQRIRKLCNGQSRRANFVYLHDTGAKGGAGAMLAVRSSEWQDLHGLRAASIPAGTWMRYRAFQDISSPGRWLELYDFGDLRSAAAAIDEIPRRRDGSIETYSAIGTPLIK